VKHVLTLEEIATACSEYVVKRHYPFSSTGSNVGWQAHANVETVAVDPAKIGATWRSNFSEGVITCVSIEVEPVASK